MRDNCDWVGCSSRRAEGRSWYVVHKDKQGTIKIYEFNRCPPRIVDAGKHFCGIAHMTLYVSNLVTPDNTKPDRESTLRLQPPLTRHGTQNEKTEETNRPGDPGIEDQDE